MYNLPIKLDLFFRSLFSLSLRYSGRYLHFTPNLF